MPSKFHHQNARIRRSLERRATRRDERTERREHDYTYPELEPGDSGDGYIVRKRICGEDDEQLADE